MAKQNVYSYIKNISTSIKYAAMDKFEEMAPAPTDFIKTNASFFKDTVDFARNYKRNTKKISNQIQRLKLYENADAIVRNAFSDLKSGKFYNKEREMKASADMFGMSDDFDFDEDNDSFDWNDLEDDSKYLGEMMDEVGSKSTNALCNMMIRTADTVNRSNRASTQLLYTQNTQMYSLVNRGMSSITENTGKLVEFSNGVMRTHVENSTKFFETSTDLQTKQLELLQKIYDVLDPQSKTNKRSYGYGNSPLTYSSINSSGVVDLKEYMKIIKNNMKSAGSSAGLDMLGMFEGMDPSSIISSFFASPLKKIPQALVNKMVSKNAEKVFKEFNDSFSGIFASMIMKLNDTADHSDNELFRKIGELLGIKTNLKQSLSTSNYEKGVIRWNGKANKALTEVIPTYLAKIEALLSGKTAKVYDYENGRFVSAEDIRSNFKDKLESRARSASYDMRNEFNKNIQYTLFDNEKEKEQLQKDIDNFFVALFKRGKIFDFNSSTIDSQFAQYGVSSKENFKRIKNMFMNSPMGMQLVINHNILRERDSYNKMMSDMELEGNDLSLMLFNNSGFADEDEKITKNKNNITKLENYKKSLNNRSHEYSVIDKEINRLKEELSKSSSFKDHNTSTTNNFLNNYVDKKGHNVFWYLENILVSIKSSEFGSGDSSYVVPDENQSMKKYMNDKKEQNDIKLRERNRSNLDSKNKDKYISFADMQNAEKFAANYNYRKESELKEEENRDKNKYYYLLGDADIDEENLTFKDKVKRASGFTNKMHVITDALTNLIQRPMDAFSKIVHRVDKKMYNMIYGGKIKTEDGKEVDGILGLLSYHIKNTFSEIKEWATDTFSHLFKNKDGEPLFDLNKIFGDKFAEFFKNTGKSFGSIFSAVGQGTQSFLDPILSKFVGKKTDSLDDILIGEETLREYYNRTNPDALKTRDGRLKNDMEILAMANSDYTIDEKTKKTIARQLGKRERYVKGATDLFTNLTRQMTADKDIGFKSSDAELLGTYIQDIFANMKLSDMGKNSTEFLRNIKSGKFFDIKDLVGDYKTDANGNISFDENADAIIKDKRLRDLFIKAMNKSNFTSLAGTNDYNLENFFKQDLDTTLTDISDEVRNVYKKAEEYNNKFYDTYKTTNKSVVSNMEHIIHLLSKIAGEKTPAPIMKKINDNMPKINDEYNIFTPFEERRSTVKDPYDQFTHAFGARYITKSGITAISKGEMIIPSDKNPFNPDRNKVNRSQEIANERRLIKEFAKGKKPDSNFRGTGSNASNATITDAEVDYIFNDEYDENRSRITLHSREEQTPKEKGFIGKGIQKAAETLGEALNKAVTSLTGKVDEANGKVSDKLKNAINDAIENSGVYGPRMLAGGVAGAFSFGALFAGTINPIIGAAIGAGAGLLSSSDKFKEWMFGVKEDGEFKNGLIPSNVVNWFAKNGKTLGLTTLGGSMTGALVGHPLIGLTLGAGMGLLNSSEKFRDYMFGEEGVIDSSKQQKILKFAKTAGIGTLVTSLISPDMGLIPKLLLGSVGGFLAQNEKFQEMIFGRKDDTTGKYEHGLLPALRHVVVDPLGRLVHGIEERTVAFIKENIVKPIQIFFEPLSRAKKKSGELLKGMFSKLTERIGDGLSRSFSNAFGPILDAIKDNPLAKSIKNIFSGVTKTIKTLINPLKWMEVAGKGMGNLFGKLGWMNNLSEEEYDKYSFNIFGKKLLAKRKGQNTMNAINEANMSKEDMKSLIDNIKVVGASRSEAKKNQTKATEVLNTKLNDLFGYSSESFETARLLAKQDENSPDYQEKLDKLLLDAYRNKYVGQDVQKAKKNLDPSVNTLRSMIINSGYSKSSADKMMEIVNNTSNIDDVMDKLNKSGIVISKPKIGRFKQEFSSYKDLMGIINGQTNEQWAALSPEEKMSIMKGDTNFDSESAKNAFIKASKDYRLADLALNDHKASEKELNKLLKANNVMNPDKFNANQLLEILEAKYKKNNKYGLWATDEENSESEENKNPTEAITDVNDTITTKADEMINLLKNIAEHLGGNYNNPEKMVEQHQSNISDTKDILGHANALAKEGMDPTLANSIVSNTYENVDTINNPFDRKLYDTLKEKEKKKAEEQPNIDKKFRRNFSNMAILRGRPHLTGDDEIDSRNAEAFREATNDGTLGARIKKLFNTDMQEKDELGDSKFGAAFKSVLGYRIGSHAFGSDPYSKDGLAAVSKGELIVDGSKYGYNNGISTNKIYNFADGTAETEDIKIVEASKEQEEVKKEEEQDKIQKQMAENIALTRQALASDQDVKNNKGKAPSFLTKIGAGLKNVFNPKKLLKKAGFIAIGAGVLLAPLLNKALEAVVPFLTETLIPKITEALPGIFEKITSLIPSLINLITESLPKFVSTIATQTLPEILKIIPAFIEGSAESVSSILSAIPNILDPILKILPATAKALFEQLLPSIINMIPDLITTISENIGPMLNSILSGIVSALGSIIKNLPSIIINVIKGIGSAWTGLFGIMNGSGRKKSKIQNTINSNIEIPSSVIQNMSAAGKGDRTRNKKSNIFKSAGSGLIATFKKLFKKEKTDTKTTEDLHDQISNVVSYQDGKSYLNGKQINPLLAHISQNSTKYANKSFNIPFVDRGITLGSDGCGVMSGAMVANGLLGEDKVTPESVALRALLTNNKAPGGGVKSKFFKPFFNSLGIDSQYHDLTNESTAGKSRSNIINALRKNNPVILMGNDPDNTGNTPFGSTNHYVVATALSDDGSKIILNDPYSLNGGDVYNTADVLDKTLVGIEATKNHAGLGDKSVNFTKTAESNNIYGSNKQISYKTNTMSYIPPASRSIAGKAFDAIAYQDLGNYNAITEDEMNDFINYWYNINGNDAFVGHADVFLEAAKRTGLDPRYILAHAAVESGWGTSKIAREKGNYFGITAYNNNPYGSATKFNVGLNGIIDGAKWIKDHFYDRGQKTLYDMIYADPNHRYAVMDDGSPNTEWIKQIASIMRKAPNAYTDSGEQSGSGWRLPFDFKSEGVMPFSTSGIANWAAQLFSDKPESTNTYDITDKTGSMGKETTTTYSQSTIDKFGGQDAYDEMIKAQNSDTTANTKKSLTSYKYVSPILDDYYNNITNTDSILLNGKYSVANDDDVKLKIMRAMYGANPYNPSYDLNQFDNGVTFTDDPSEILKSIYRSYVSKALPDKDKDQIDQEADLVVKSINKSSTVYANGLKGVHELYSKARNKMYGSIAPLIMADLNPTVDGISVDNAIYRALIKEFLYNPAIMDDDNRLKELALRFYKNGDDSYEEKIRKADLLKNNIIDPLITKIRKEKIKLNYDQTMALYGSPAIYYKGKDTLVATPFGSEKYIDDKDNILKKYSDIIIPSSDAVAKINSIADATLEDQKDVVDQYRIGVKNKENGIDDKGDGVTTSESDSDKPKGLLAILRGIGSTFSEVFDKLGEMLFGINTSTGEQAVGDGIYDATNQKQQDKSKLAVNNKYRLVPDENNKTTITVRQRPDYYADSKTKENSLIIKYFMTMPSHYTGWPLPVYGKCGDNIYLLSDGYTLTIPRFDIIDGYDSVPSLITGSAADDYFINMLKANGATGTYKSSNGPAKDTLYGANRPHTGIDYATKGVEGTPIVSPVSGKVVISKYSNSAGNYAVIKDDGSTDGKQRYHRFMHMQSLPSVKANDKVSAGQVIGYVGNTGQSSGAHLHYDIADDKGYLGGYSDVNSIRAHYLDPNEYLSKYFNKNGYPTTATTEAKTYTATDTTTGKGGPSNDNQIEDIYKAIIQMITYLSKISDNTSLIGEIVTLLTQIDAINDDKSLNNTEKQEKKSKIRQDLVDKTKEYARILNSANNESTGNKDLVRALQFIASQ